MPESTTNTETKTSSFLGLQSYTEAQSNSFFGRDAETDTLTSLVELNTLTIVFGRSGTGKTSLLNAGVFPKLRKSFCLPFRIRLEFNDNSSDLVTQIKKVLKEEIDKYGFKVDSYPSSETLWEYFHKEPLWKTVTPIIVFDQFEEIFTLAKANPRFASVELPLFWEELSNLIENNIPDKLKEKFLNQKEKIGFNYKKQKAKIVFSFREEYLPEFETIASKIPSLKYSRFRLLPMNGHQAYEVITKTWKENINPSEAKQIVSYFTNEPGLDDYSLLTVEPSLLSQVCAYIDKERMESGGGKVSAELLNKYPKETILRTLYDEAITNANNVLKIGSENVNRKNYIKEFIEEKLITSEGYRTKYNLGVSEEMLRPGINVLAAKYFIREDDNAVELTHDVLAPIIKSDREKRRNGIALAAARKRARKKAIIFIIAALLIAGGVFAIFAYLSNEKIKEKNKAEIALNNAKQQEQKLTEANNLLNRQIESKKKQLSDLEKRLKPDGTKTIIVTDSASFGQAIDQLQSEIRALEAIKAELDSSIAVFKLKINENSRIQTQKEIEIANLKSEIRSFAQKADVDKSAIRELNKQIEVLNNSAVKDKETIRILRDSVKYYMNMNKKLNETIQELLNRNPGSTFPGNLRIQVYDKSGETKIPITKDTFLVYIIPNTGANEDVLEKNKNILFTKDCEEFSHLLPKLNSWQKAYFKDGYYYFHDVIQNGKYKIKICNILDGYFSLQMPSPSGEVYWKQNEKQKIAIKLGRF